jgi:hypothetical protein
VSGMWNKGPYSCGTYNDGRVAGPGQFMWGIFCEKQAINEKVAQMLNIAYEQGRDSIHDEMKGLLGIKECDQ